MGKGQKRKSAHVKEVDFEKQFEKIVTGKPKGGQKNRKSKTIMRKGWKPVSYYKSKNYQ